MIMMVIYVGPSRRPSPRGASCWPTAGLVVAMRACWAGGDIVLSHAPLRPDAIEDVELSRGIGIGRAEAGMVLAFPLVSRFRSASVTRWTVRHWEASTAVL